MNDELDTMIRRYGDELGRAERRTTSRQRLPLRRIAIGGAVAGLALGVGVAVLPGGGGTKSGSAYAVERVKQVLDPNGSIVHYRLVDRPAAPSGSGDQAALSSGTVTDVWFVSRSQSRVRLTVKPPQDAKGERPFTIDTSTGDGKVRTWASADRVIRQTPAAKMPRLDSSLSDDPVAQVRTFLDDGRMVDAGEVNRDGRRLRKLQTSAAAERQFGRMVMLVDAETFEPVELELLGIVSDVRDYERIPLNEANLTLLDIDAPAGVPVVVSDQVSGG